MCMHAKKVTYMHVNDPVVHVIYKLVRVQWIMETQK